MKHLYKYVAIFVFILFDGLYSFSLCRQYAPNYFAELAMEKLNSCYLLHW